MITLPSNKIRDTAGGFCSHPLLSFCKPSSSHLFYDIEFLFLFFFVRDTLTGRRVFYVGEIRNINEPYFLVSNRQRLVSSDDKIKQIFKKYSNQDIDNTPFHANMLESRNRFRVVHFRLKDERFVC